MEWATQWHGPEGKVHADKRTVEYTGRGNHSADAVSFVGAISVGQAHAERTRREAFDRMRRAPCLVSPFDGSIPSSGSHEAEGGRDLSSAAAVGNTSESNGTNKSRTGRKKRRVAVEDKRECDRASCDVLQLPVYYFEVQVLATRHFQGDPGDLDGAHGRPYASHRDVGSNQEGDDDEEDDEEENGDEDSEMKEDEDDEDAEESDEVEMEVDLLERGAGIRDDAQAPWRGRARRLIHNHLRATSDGIASTTNERTALGSGSGGSATRQNGNGSETTSELDGGTNGESLEDHSSHHINGNGSGSSSRLLRSTSSTMSPPSPPQLTHQQLLLSFPLSSSTIHQIRLRLERQHQQAQSHRRRYSSSEATESGSVSLTTAISSIHARHRRETVRRKRSNHRVAVGFLFSKHEGDYKRDICHDELGRQACGIAFVGKTGAIVSNGQIFLQTDVRFGHGDTVGCGVILDTRTFFWTVNGRLVATLAVNDVHHLDGYDDHSVTDGREANWVTSWADQLLPSVSLHEHGECVRAQFGDSQKERFRFDVASFKQQELKRRQTDLAAYASAKTRTSGRDEEETMHKLIEDYFAHFGYGNALATLHSLHQGSSVNRTRSYSDSVTLRHAVRQSIYGFKTREALRQLESKLKHITARDPMVLLHCHFLCVVDVLYQGNQSKRDGSNTEAITTAQDILREYLSEANGHAEHMEEIKSFMSVLLYRSVEEIPDECRGRRFLVWDFREEVADALNYTLSSESPEPSALETLVDDLSELRQQCLTSGASPFPLDEDSHRASRFYRVHKRFHEHSKRSNNRRSGNDSDDDIDDNSQSASSNESEEGDDGDDDDDE